MSFIILLAGIPATGKTAFGEYLSAHMMIPMASKDQIKEHLYDTVGFKDRAEKVALGEAATDIMYHFAEAHLRIGHPVILENNFENTSKPGLLNLLGKYRCKTVTVFFHADIEVICKRIVRRDRSPERHRGHVVNTQYPEIGEKTMCFEAQAITPENFQKAMEARGMLNFSIGGDTICVDTTDFSKVCYEKIADEIKAKAYGV